MAKGSVRNKGKKWYYRFYVEDASGNLVQKEKVTAKITFVLSRQYYSSHSDLQYHQSNISLSIRCSILN